MLTEPITKRLPRLYESLRAQICVGYEPFHMVYETINLTKQCSMKYACEMRDYPMMKAKRIYGRLQGFLKGKAIMIEDLL